MVGGGRPKAGHVGFFWDEKGEQLFLEVVKIQVRTGFVQCLASMENMRTISADAITASSPVLEGR